MTFSSASLTHFSVDNNSKNDKLYGFLYADKKEIAKAESDIKEAQSKFDRIKVDSEKTISNKNGNRFKLLFAKVTKFAGKRWFLRAISFQQKRVTDTFSPEKPWRVVWELCIFATSTNQKNL